MKRIILVLVLIGIVSLIYYLEGLRPDQLNSDELSDSQLKLESVTEKEDKYPQAREITKPSGFINTAGEAIKIADHIGKEVILLDIWTYSCINCQRTLPFITAWDEKYRDSGLLVIGIHTPEFEFEKDIENVKQAVKKWGIEYPVVLDNERGTWQAYQNRYWPRKYLIDIDGYVVYDHIGEGGYEETEKKIQELLKERAQKLGQNLDISEDLAGVKDQSADPNQLASPETYFGAFRNQNFGNGTAGKVGRANYKIPEEILPNYFYLEGDWDISEESITNKSKGAKILFNYSAKDIYFVAGTVGETKQNKVRVSLDGKTPKESAGEDLNQDGSTMVKETQLYRLIEDPSGYGSHIIELEFLDLDTEVFTFTFG